MYKENRNPLPGLNIFLYRNAGRFIKDTKQLYVGNIREILIGNLTNQRRKIVFSEGN